MQRRVDSGQWSTELQRDGVDGGQWPEGDGGSQGRRESLSCREEKIKRKKRWINEQ